jgi:hypothetical protein
MTTSNPFSQLDMFGPSPEPAPDTPPQKTIQAEPLKPATTAQTGLVFGQRPPAAAKGSDKHAGKEHKTGHRAARAMTPPPPAPTRQIAEAPALLRSSVLLAFLRACAAHAQDLHRQLIELEERAPLQAIDQGRLADDARAFIESPALRAAIGLRALDLMVEQGGEIGITELAPPTPARSTTNESGAQPDGGMAQPASRMGGADGQVLASAAPLAAPKVQHDENAWYRRTDRHTPIVRRVVIVGDQRHPYQPPGLDFRTTSYGTPFTKLARKAHQL